MKRTFHVTYTEQSDLSLPVNTALDLAAQMMAWNDCTFRGMKIHRAYKIAIDQSDNATEAQRSRLPDSIKEAFEKLGMRDIKVEEMNTGEQNATNSL